MGGFAGRELLDLWERACGLSPQRRALVLADAVGLSAAGVGHAGPAGLPVGAGEPVGAQPVGVRDTRLLALHMAVAGPTLDAVAGCPACAKETEFALDAPTLRKSAEHIEARGATQVGGRSVAWRVPTGDDLVDLEPFDDPEAAAAELLTRCVESGAELTDGERALVTGAIADADPLAEVLVDLACPACGRSFTAEVDVAEFAWRAVRDAARRLLLEVDVLARAYGWSEPEILALTEWRRAAYLELVVEGP